jgi:tetratricopeptide (TPR) repeat protein
VGWARCTSRRIPRSAAKWRSSSSRRVRPQTSRHAQGEIALAEGRFDEALRLLEAASLSDRDEDLIESVAAANAAAGHLDVAAKRYEELLAAPRFGNESQELWFRSHATLGGVYERLGRMDEARRTYEALVKIWKDGDADGRAEGRPGEAREAGSVNHRLPRISTNHGFHGFLGIYAARTLGRDAGARLEERRHADLRSARI